MIKYEQAVNYFLILFLVVYYCFFSSIVSVIYLSKEGIFIFIN